MEIINTYYINLTARYFFGEATPEEILELEAWVKAESANAVVFSEYQKTWQAVENARDEPVTDLDHEWNNLVSKIEIKEAGILNQKHSLRRPQSLIAHQKSIIPYWFLRIAAIFLLVAVPVFFLYRYLTTSVETRLTAGNELIEHTLPDGTVVTLNTGATLTFPSRFDGPFRRITLQGEAWFEVAHDQAKPFVIATENVRIRVVGTSFSINTKNRDGHEEIILSSGIVKVYYENKPEKTALLFSGERAELSADGYTIIKSANEDVNFLAWKTKHMVFVDTPLNEVAALLTKVYRTDIRLSDNRLNDCKITTTFDRQSLESVLNVLKATLDLQIRNTGPGIEISGYGCYQSK